MPPTLTRVTSHQLSALVFTQSACITVICWWRQPHLGCQNLYIHNKLHCGTVFPNNPSTNEKRVLRVAQMEHQTRSPVWPAFPHFLPSAGVWWGLTENWNAALHPNQPCTYGPDYTLHTAITRVITVLKWWRLTYVCEFRWRLTCETLLFPML